MNKIILILISIIIIIISVIIGTNIYNNINSTNNSEIELLNEKIEMKQVDTETKNESIENLDVANANVEVRLNENAIITVRHSYLDCEHEISETVEIDKELVNKSENEVKEMYKNYIIDKFTEEEVVFINYIEGMCNEHFILRSIDDNIVVFSTDKEGNESVYDYTNISTFYLPESDRLNIEKGIIINDLETLNRLIEDFSS